MSARHRTRLALVGLAVAAVGTLATGCRGQTSREEPIVPIRNMYEQPRYDMQGESRYFADTRTMRPPVEGTVAREAILDDGVRTGHDGTSYVLTVPEAVVSSARIPARHGKPEVTGMRALLERGRERYGIYCTPCHGGAGDGDGAVVARGFQAPPTLHSDRLRRLPDGQVFATISNGIRVMPAYRHAIPVQDRWAIVAYVRALQVSQAARASADAPPRQP